MRNGANADICGILKEDILIKNTKDGLICGLIHVLEDDPHDIPNQNENITLEKAVGK